MDQEMPSSTPEDGKQSVDTTPLMLSPFFSLGVYDRFDQQIVNDGEEEFDIRPGMSFQKRKLRITDSSKKPLERRPAPIIIVPCDPISLITTDNARDILETLKYISPEDNKSTTGMKDFDPLISHRSASGETMFYEIIGSPEKLIPEQWDRVVAVFVSGQEEQFKKWPSNGTPTEILKHVCGIHLKYDDTDLHPNVSKWDVPVVEISKTKRDLDKDIFESIWLAIDVFLVANKPWLQ